MYLVMVGLGMIMLKIISPNELVCQFMEMWFIFIIPTELYKHDLHIFSKESLGWKQGIKNNGPENK